MHHCDMHQCSPVSHGVLYTESDTSVYHVDSDEVLLTMIIFYVGPEMMQQNEKTNWVHTFFCLVLFRASSCTSLDVQNGILFIYFYRRSLQFNPEH